MSKKTTFMGSLWGKGNKLPLSTKPIIGNATKSGNIWSEKRG